MTTLKQRAEAVAVLALGAAPGPWYAEGSSVKRDALFMGSPCVADCWRYALGGIVAENTASFIAAAHDMAALIADQQAEIERLSTAVYSAIFTIQQSCVPASNPDVDDKAEVASTLAMLRAALAPIPTNTEAESNGN